MQIAILKCKKDFILNGGPAKDPLFAKVGDTVVGAYDSKNNEVLSLVEGKYVVVIEMDESYGVEHFDFEAVIGEEDIENLRAVDVDRKRYSR